MDFFYNVGIGEGIIYGVCIILLGFLGYQIIKFIIHNIKLLSKKTKK